MIISDPHLAADLLRGPYARPVQIPMPDRLKPHVFEFSLRRMQELLNDPDREKWNLGNENDDGLQRKSPTTQNPTADYKWFFHQKLLTFWNLAEKSCLNTHRYKDFLASNDFIIRIAIETVTPYIDALDQRLPGYAFKRNFLAGNHVLRLIVDDPPASTGNLEVANKHTDYAFCTLHLWESRPEFQWYNEKSKQWEHITDEPKIPTAILFLGRKAALMTGGKRMISPTGEQTKEVVPHSGLLRPLLHRVREIGNPTELTTPRRAVVAFFHTPLVL